MRVKCFAQVHNTLSSARAPSKDKESLEKVEKKYIEEHADKFGSLINKKCNIR